MPKIKKNGNKIESDSSDDDIEMMEGNIFAPGLHIEEEIIIPKKNDVMKLRSILENITPKFEWVERLDLYSDLAPLAPELVVQLEQQEQRRQNEFKGNHKIRYIAPESDPVLNDFKREMLFHRQAQSAAIEGIKKLHVLNIAIKRPDDYFAEMAKSDSHMQKVRARLLAKQEGQAKSERIKRLRQQRILGKALQRKARLGRVMEKKDMIDNLKKYRKGKLKNLDFLEDNKSKSDGFKGKGNARGKGNRTNGRNSKGGGSGKRNASSSRGGGGDSKSSQRMGKNQRVKSKGRNKRK